MTNRTWGFTYIYKNLTEHVHIKMNPKKFVQLELSGRTFWSAPSFTNSKIQFVSSTVFYHFFYWGSKFWFLWQNLECRRGRDSFLLQIEDVFLSVSNWLTIRTSLFRFLHTLLISIIKVYTVSMTKFQHCSFFAFFVLF